MFLRRVLRSRAGTVGWIILLFFLALGIVGPFIAPHDPTAQDILKRNLPPTFELSSDQFHPMGTDQLGRDILSRVIYGSRISLIIGVVVVTLGGGLGCALGIIAGYYKGWADRILMRLVDIFLAFPFILLALVVIAALGPSFTNMILVLVITGWVNYARVIRSEVLAIREREFITASRVVGATGPWILLRHIFPNVIPTLIVIATLELARVIILESALSFLGLGVQPPTPSWGRMLAEGRDYVATAWWLATFPGLALLFMILSVNLVGDWLRDYLDPRRRGAM